MKPSINPRCPYCGVRHKATKSERCAELAEQEQADDAPAPTDNQRDDGLADRVRALLDDWSDFEHDAMTCPKYVCPDCTMLNAIHDLRAVVDGPTTGDGEGA